LSDAPAPAWAQAPLFPFEGELRVKALQPRAAHDPPRSGEEGGGPCRSCAKRDDEYLWVSERWRVAPGGPSVVPMVFLETRAHLDLPDLDEALAAELGPMILRIDRAMTAALPDVGRVHVHRWGDGAEHFHTWHFARPVGDPQLVGFGLVLWAQTLPPPPKDEWDATMAAIAAALAAG